MEGLQTRQGNRQQSIEHQISGISQTYLKGWHESPISFLFAVCFRAQPFVRKYLDTLFM